MPWYYAVAERDHEIQNPTNAEKIALLGNYLGLTPDSRVIDLACGKGGPAILLASTFGCKVLGIERAPEFVEAAHERVAAVGVGDLVEIIEADAHAYPLEEATSLRPQGLGRNRDNIEFGVTIETRLEPIEPPWRRLAIVIGKDDVVAASESGGGVARFGDADVGRQRPIANDICECAHHVFIGGVVTAVVDDNELA